MKSNFLFSVFPFINGADTTLCKLQDSDDETLLEVFKDNNLMYGPKNYIQTTETAFKLKRYIELGFFNKENPNTLLGTINIGRIDNILESVCVEVLYKKDAALYTELAVADLTAYLFEFAEVKRVYSMLKNPSLELEQIFIGAGFEKEGCLRQSTLNAKNEICDLAVYGIMKD